MAKLRQRKASAISQAAEGTLGEWLGYLAAAPHGRDWRPVWPPDTFAIAAALLRRTGAYVSLVNGSLPQPRGRAQGSALAADAGQRWRAALNQVLTGDRTANLREACPREIRGWWSRILEFAETPLEECSHHKGLTEAAACLCIASDAACHGLGLDADSDAFLATAEGVLHSNDRRSFCWEIAPSKLAVLGKQHTPQRGCTVRSLTHHLALYAPMEIHARWDGPYHSAEDDDLDVFNLLLLPWPTEVKASDFRMSPRNRARGPMDAEPRHHRYFDYAPDDQVSPAKLAHRVAGALEIATREADQIHGIVMPELALTPAQYLAVEEVAARWKTLLISGIREAPSKKTNSLPRNSCAIQPFGLTSVRDDVSRGRTARDLMRRIQSKHHRWCLDRNQILQYELGGRLPASFDCWERVFIGQRDINFVTLDSWLTVCVLVCEDLARQDPVTEVIRAVGPNLVVALLMDGPQLSNRWPSRYASVLAEDPGSSVLTLTSLGMSRRSRPGKPSDTNRSATIALWRDAVYGEREIALGDGHDACVLSLVCKSLVEYTIDGRSDNQQAHFPVFAGTFSFDCERDKSRSKPAPRRPRRRAAV